MEIINFLATNTTGVCNKIPAGVVNIVHIIILAIQIAVPILLIIWGMLDFAKSVIGGDEDQIKKGQKVFIKRLIAAIIVFLVVTITTLVLNLVGEINADGTNTNSIISCVNKFIKGA